MLAKRCNGAYEMTIAVYQGVDGAYSQLVIAHYLREAGLEASTAGVPSYREMATTVAGLRADVGVIPIENAIVAPARDATAIAGDSRIDAV